MTPSQIIADNAPRVATCQGGKVKNESGQKKGEGRELVMLATKVDLREVRRDSTIYHLILVCKDLILSTNDSPPLPSALSSLLQEFEDIFPEEIPAGLPPLRGIEHQIDLIPGAPLPNRPSYGAWAQALADVALVK